MSWLAVWGYVSLTGFVVGSLIRWWRYWRMPLHVRWELYPVARGSGKVAYGGSYFEEIDWWTKPRETRLVGEIGTLATEVLVLKMVRKNNPRLWLPSLLFHWGLYLLFVLGAALLSGAAARRLGLVGFSWLSGGRAFSLLGLLALVLATVGCCALLARRLHDPSLRNASTPADFVHLGLLLAVFLASWGSWLFADRHYRLAAGFLDGLLSGRDAANSAGWVAAQLLLLGVFLAYLPWSQMAHMFGKYFTWHSVRWDDTPNLPGTPYDAKVQRLLLRPLSWAAPHISGGRRGSWADVLRTGRGDDRG